MLPIFLWVPRAKLKACPCFSRRGSVSHQPEKSAPAEQLEFMNLPRKVEMMRLLLIAVIIQTVKHMLKNEAAFPLLSRVTRTPTSEVQKARASFQLCPWHPEIGNGLP